MTRNRRPTPVARVAVEISARLLRTPADRRRYQAEFVAELYGLPVSRQLHHATGVLFRAHDLRAALGRSSTRSEEVGMHVTTAGQRFRCRYLRWHHWSVFSTSDGHRYLGCAARGPGALPA